MTPPVIAVVGYSDAGKTTVASSLIQALVSRGYRVAAVKHCAHGHEVLDKPSSDSAQLFQAGATRVVMSSPNLLTSIESTNWDTPLERIVASFDSSYDLVIAEGFKGSTVPKIMVIREEPLPSSTNNVFAVVSDHKTDWEMPCYTLQEMHMLATQIESLFLGQPDTPRGSTSDGIPE